MADGATQWKAGPVLVTSCDEAVPALNNVVVAPLTSTLRSIPTCIPIRREEGVDHDSVASFDSIAAAPKSVLTTRLGALSGSRHRIREAFGALADC